MSSQFEEARRMLVRAIAEIKGGEFLTAQRYLERMITIPSTSDQKAEAYYWMSEIAEDEAEKLDHLQSALGYDMTHHRARKKLSILQGKLKESEIIDPDQFKPTTAEGTQKRSGERFECPTCGSRMVFSADGQTLLCEYCDSESHNRGLRELEEEAFLIGISTGKGHQQARATQSFECRACGAVFLLAPEILSLTCPHCDSTYAIDQAEIRELIAPEGIIPMALTRDDVEDRIRQWYRERSRKSLKLRFETTEGIYLPAWTFDLSGFIKWSGLKAADNDQLIRVMDSRAIHFDDIFVPASKPEPKRLKRLVREYRASDVVPFSTEYLANWLAESYQVTMADAALSARAIAFRESQEQQKIKSGLSELQNLQFYSDDILLESYKLVLVPIWITHLHVEDEPFEVLVDGKFGKVYAKSPPGLFKRAMDWLLEK